MKRSPLLAGSWYESDPDSLYRSIERFFSGTEEAGITGEILGLICPHAGHFYSGAVAAAAYNQVTEQPDLVIIISPSHRLVRGRYLINASSHYLTPLGEVPVDRETVDRLRSEAPVTMIDSDQEHSIEIQLPFLQYRFDSFNLLPIMVGHNDVDDCDDIVQALLTVCSGKKALFIASSDLHHIDNYSEVHKQDQEVIAALESMNMEDIRRRLRPGGCSVCGRVPITIVLDVCRRLGADRLEVVQHTTSGDVTGEKERGGYTVGYLAAAVFKR